jgi:hypothetical protein
MPKYRFKVTTIIDAHGPDVHKAREALFDWIQDIPTQAEDLEFGETIVYLMGKHKYEKELTLESN